MRLEKFFFFFYKIMIPLQGVFSSSSLNSEVLGQCFAHDKCSLNVGELND